MTHSIKNQKSNIRSKIRQLRKSISGEQALKAGTQLRDNLKKLDNYASYQSVACFLSFDGEIDTRPVLDMLIEDKQRCFLPKLRPSQPNRLWFMPYTGRESMRNNRLGIPEVELTVNHALAVSKLDIILMPLVAFDEAGNRLGMGGGFYDATLAHLKQTDKRPLCIGLAFEQQKIESIPTQRWDYPLDGVLTQNNYYSF